MEQPGAAAPLTTFRLALSIGRARARRQLQSDPVALRRLIDELRADATSLGDCDESWELLDEAAGHERIYWAMTA